MNPVAVVIVNYATPDLAIAAVESVLARDHGGRDVIVHLVDNASPGDDAARFEAAQAAGGWGARVVLHPQSDNLGFGRGNNVVLDALLAQVDAPSFAFLLNPDARLDGETIDILARALEADPRAGAAGAAVLGEDGVPQAGAFRFPTPSDEIRRILSFGPLDRLLGRRSRALPVDAPEGPVDWLTGAAVMFRLDALRETGTFDPAFFLYFEEVELMHRLDRAGWKNLYVPRARIIHAVGASTASPFEPGVRKRQKAYIYQSWMHYFQKIYGRPAALITALSMLIAGGANVVTKAVRGQKTNLPLHFFSDQWQLVVVPLLTGGGK